MGMIEQLRIPRTRHLSITEQVLHPFAANQSAVTEALKGLFLAGVSTRRVGEVVKPFLGHTVSASFVSNLTKTLDPHVRAFHERPLEDRYLYLFFDGIVLKGKEALGAKKRVILVAYGIRTDGHKELIDFLIHRSESEDAWKALLDNLYRRGLLGLHTQLIITDGSKGLHAALDTVYPRIPRQRCWVHKLRNVANKLRRCLQAECLAQAKGIYLAGSKRQAVERFHRWAARWRRRAPKAATPQLLRLPEGASLQNPYHQRHRAHLPRGAQTHPADQLLHQRRLHRPNPVWPVSLLQRPLAIQTSDPVPASSKTSGAGCLTVNRRGFCLSFERLTYTILWTLPVHPSTGSG
jgi:hypothetical protein